MRVDIGFYLPILLYIYISEIYTPQAEHKDLSTSSHHSIKIAHDNIVN